ncbi:MAG: type IV pilus biogenesis/stability protein PilW [Xanthomonadales bacterium]|nr:type IV pilus biogenesis/stability protein PilW [Xanthomonadales bacterium]
MRRRLGIVVVLLHLLLASSCAVDGSAGYVSPRGDASPQRRKAANVQVSLARGYMEQGRLEVALEKLKRAITLDARSAPAYSMLGLLYERINDPLLAEQNYRQAVLIDPTSGDMNNNLGGFLCRSGKAEESLQYFDKAVQDPFYGTPQAALANAGLCARSVHRSELAEGYFRRALQRDPNFPAALLPMAAILHRNGEHLRARAFAQRYEAAQGENAEFLALAVEIEHALGDERAASDYASRLLSRYPDSTEARQLKEKQP